MTAKRSQRLNLVLDLAKRKQAQADRFLAEATQRVQQAEAQREQLQKYLLEYQMQFTQAGQQGLSPAQLQNHQAFINRLQTALRQQAQTLNLAQQQLEQVTRHWQETYAQTQGVDKLTQKVLQEEQRQQDKKEQQAIDERAQHRTPGPF
ncbi:flagellar export protein FliJ [Nitrincola tapanii]|uniref:Flagellar FliJ protein n=1 Tax=Nitrincola tapanii TaxID=1708751 RepID=A0A5A9W750_9GAMM|nr:flagellar export protein FliJ [Nitrincola tapanii]KAA0876617.1 flagellar export protein FliJ [Nitrincola tapanii]